MEENGIILLHLLFPSPVTLYDKLPPDTRDAILCEAAAYSTMLEGMDHGAAMLREKAAKLRAAAEGIERDKSGS